ncbi:glycosyltransferase [Thiobacillus sp.]|uniref:glycosyltransferase n=1 Tax=Thiobacillus sp. TaxID=924 RepID=UPI00286EAD6F|nr:glycosyltransferase [Thiobacillus sp.]
MAIQADRILLVSPASPFDPQSGAQQRTALLHQALQRLGEVDTVLIEPGAGPSRLEPAKPGVLAHGVWHQRPLGIGKFKPDRHLQQALLSAGVDLGQYRLIVSRYLNPICKLAIPRGTRTVVDLDDWGYHYAPGAMAMAARLKSTYAAQLAKRQLKRFDAFFFVSPRDQACHLDLPSVLLPNIPFNPPAAPFPQTDNPTLLFVGSLWYPPNREGIDRFLAHSWPAIKAAQPQAHLLLVGAAPLALRQAWELHPDVSAPGFVDNLDEAYRNAAFTIAPIHSGGGTNIKILESLAYGRACVTTPHCADAFSAELGTAGLAVASDAALFAQHCIAWLSDIERRGSAAAKGQGKIKNHYTHALFDERVAQLCALGHAS